MLHDKYYEQVGKKWGLERGDRWEDLPEEERRKRKHKTKQEAYDEQKAKEAKENAEKEAERAIKKRDDINEEVKKAETRLKGLNTMLDNLEKHRLDVLADIEILENENINNEVEKDELEAKLRKLKTDLQLTEDKIDERKEQLKVAMKQLKELGHRQAEIQNQYDDLRRQINRFQPELHEGTIRHMESIGWNVAAEEAARNWKSVEELHYRLSDDKISQIRFDDLFENSMFETMALRGEQTIAIASALFLGYLDQATQYAESVGGGGGPDSGWGRKKDEDDMAFGKRCFLMAKNMLSPSNDGEEQELASKKKTGLRR